jgi:toxin YhaV
MDVNDWLILYFTAFQERLNDLEQAVLRIQQARPEQFAKHPTVKLLKAVVQAILVEVPRNPASPLFEQGNTLGSAHRHWRRVKRRLPPRYRLFFQFSSLQSQIVFAWLNDESSLRQDGAKTDVYRVFKRLLDQGKVPDSWDQLVAASAPAGPAA